MKKAIPETAIVISMHQCESQPCGAISNYRCDTAGRLAKYLSLLDPDTPVLLEDLDAGAYKFDALDVSVGIREVDIAQARMFNQCFDEEQYRKAKAEVERSLARYGLRDLGALMKELGGYDEDEEGESFYCETEIDRAGMECGFDFASIEFLIWWCHKAACWKIDSTKLYVGDYGSVCSIDPETCAVTEWH